LYAEQRNFPSGAPTIAGNLLETTVTGLEPHKREAMHEEHVATLDHLALLAQAIRAPRTFRNASDTRFKALLRNLVTNLEGNVEDHFRFEEVHLFPALRKAGHAELTDTLLLEHAELRTAGRSLLDQLDAALEKDLSDETWSGIGLLAMALIEKQRAHMQREESEMVPALRAAQDGVGSL
jgi:hemerythrin-like domain-containing protein